MKGAQLGVGEPRVAAAEADLGQARAGADDDREGARADLEIERAVIAGRDGVEAAGVVGDDAGEDVEPAGRGFRIGGGGDIVRQVEAFQQRHDIDAAGLEHRAVGEVDLVQPEIGDALGDGQLGPGRNEARTRIGDIAGAKIEARRLDLVRIERTPRADAAILVGQRSRSPAPEGCRQPPLSAHASPASRAPPRLNR